MTTQHFPVTIKRGSISVRIYRLIRADGRMVFTLSWHSGGRRFTKQFADYDGAYSEGTIKADQLNAGRIEGAEMSRGDRDELQAARELAGATTVLAALREWGRAKDLTQGHVIAAAEAWKARNSNAFKRATIADAVKDFTAAKKRAGVDVKCSYNKILPALSAEFATRPIDTISARELQNWMDEKYPHPVTRNTARKRFVALWRWCRKQGHLPRDSQTEAEQTETAREAVREIGIINSETFARVLRHFHTKHPEYLAALVIAGFTGLRRSEIHEQKWEDIALGRKILRVTKAKRNTPAKRIVPLSDAAVEWLLLCKERKGEICTNFALDRIRKIGIEAKFKLPDNCFRHSYISHEVARTANVAETALAAGNSPAIIFQHYRELFSKADGEAWFATTPAKAASSGELISMDEKAVAS